MFEVNDEAKAIARLFGADGERVLGIVYVWETGEFAILWLDRTKEAFSIEPTIDAQLLVDGEKVTPAETLKKLSEFKTR